MVTEGSSTTPKDECDRALYFCTNECFFFRKNECLDAHCACAPQSSRGCPVTLCDDGCEGNCYAPFRNTATCESACRNGESAIIPNFGGNNCVELCSVDWGGACRQGPSSSSAIQAPAIEAPAIQGPASAAPADDTSDTTLFTMGLLGGFIALLLAIIAALLCFVICI